MKWKWILTKFVNTFLGVGLDFEAKASDPTVFRVGPQFHFLFS